MGAVTHTGEETEPFGLFFFLSDDGAPKRLFRNRPNLEPDLFQNAGFVKKHIEYDLFSLIC